MDPANIEYGDEAQHRIYIHANTLRFLDWRKERKCQSRVSKIVVEAGYDSKEVEELDVRYNIDEERKPDYDHGIKAISL